MGWWHKLNRKEVREHQLAEQQSFVEVVQLKSKTHRSVKQADKSIQKLNKLLRADGITLKIYIARGGGRGN